MLEQRYRWKNKQLREHVDVLGGKLAPTLVLMNATYLNQMLRAWMTANIWIYEDRIVYVGDNMPEMETGYEIVDCAGEFLVPGYIEPHAHPFQLYNPETLGTYAAQFGTTTLINDNIMLFSHLEKAQAFALLKELRHHPVSMYWWARLDSQTELRNEEEVFSHPNVKAWLEHDGVLQAGELTGWPKLLDGDDMMLHWIQEAKRMRKQIEGHFPGASEKTLAKLMLLGADCDHEAMNGEEVIRRLSQGYTVSLRHSSIRPDLPRILDDLMDYGLQSFDKLFFNTDGSTPGFYEEGFTDRLIMMAIERGIPLVDAYNMASLNIARYYNIEYLHGNIATGRVANINFLSAKDRPTPHSVLAKGQWVKRNGVSVEVDRKPIDWSSFGMDPLQLDWDLTESDLQYSMPFGINMENSVITKPYSIHLDVSRDVLSEDHDENFFTYLTRDGKFRINTMLKGFARNLYGFASSFSNAGDILLIGKSKSDMKLAFNRMKEIGGGIVLAEKGNIIFELPLPLLGMMSNQELSELLHEEKKLKELLIERGYVFEDPVYSLLFFSSTHLPYLRVTQAGLYDVMNKSVLFPTIMR